MQNNMLKKTALHAVHAELGARFTDFGGWDMPLKYTSELEEHKAVRTTVGIFDLSHMGEVRVLGKQAAEFLDYALISQLSAIAVGKAKYSMICTENGGIIDDLITYRLAEEEFLVVPNAGNIAAVVTALEERITGFDATLSNESDDTTMVAIQGPASVEIMHSLTDATAIDSLGYYAAFKGTFAGVDALIARTGYTGEDGFEVIVPNSVAQQIWEAACTLAQEKDGLPCGLACRDTLRLEAGMPLYGHELSLQLTPVDAGLGVLAATKAKDNFVGREALVAAKTNSVESPKTLVGLVGEGRRAAREGYEVYQGDVLLGAVTSGALSPTLGYPVAMAYLTGDVPSEVEVDIRGKRYPYRVVSLPFYKREQ